MNGDLAETDSEELIEEQPAGSPEDKTIEHRVEALGEEPDMFCVRTVLPILGGDSIEVISVWRLSPEGNCVTHHRTYLEMHQQQLELGHSFTPHLHLDILRSHLAEIRQIEVGECEPDTEDIIDRETVFLAQGSEFAQVFLDRLSAVLWAGSPKRVKEVSVEAARCALKTDKETVLANALFAKEREYDYLRILQQVHQIADDTLAFLEENGLTDSDSSLNGDS